MSDRYLSTEIFYDDVVPNLSAEPALAGIDIVKSIAPWLRIERGMNPVRVGRSDDTYISTDAAYWPRFSADLNIVLTNRRLVCDEDLHSDGRLNYKKLASKDHLIGAAFSRDRVYSNRVALVDSSSIRRPEHIVAHEIGHLLGIMGSVDDNLHCESRRCLMSPMQYAHGRADRAFCECCKQQLHDNSLKLRKAKAGRFAVFNSKIF